MIIKVSRDIDFAQQIGNHIYFDLVDHDKVHQFRIQKQMPFSAFKEKVAKEFGVPVQFQRFWFWAKRQNYTYRPYKPLTPLEEAQSVGQLREASIKTYDAELNLFLEVEFGPDYLPVQPPEKTKEDLLLFFKFYDPEAGELRYAGRLFVKNSGKPIEILEKLNQMAGFAPDEEIELYEEIKFKPSVMCEHLDKRTSFQRSEIEDGDIICFQKAPPPESEESCQYPDVPSFLEYVHNRQVVHFRSMEKPKEDDFCLEMSKKHSYDDVVERVARRINLDDPSKIRLTSHNWYSQQPKPTPIKYRGAEHLFDMLIHYNQTSDILFYEVLDTPLPELQGLKNLKVAFHHATKDEVVIHNIRLPKESMVGDVINELKTKVELSHPNAELRLLKVFYHKIHKIFPSNEKIENINDKYWTLRAEEIPEEEKNLGPHYRLIHVYHFTKESAQNRHVQNFGEPFFLVIHEGEKLAEIKLRIQKKLQVPDEEFAKWKFAFLSLRRPEYLKDGDVVFTRFQRRNVYGAWEQYLGLEHSDNAPKRPYAVNQAADATGLPEKRPFRPPDNEASRKKQKSEHLHSLQGELENHASHVIESDAGICSEKDREKPDSSKVSSKATESLFDKMATSLLEKLEDEKDPYSLRIYDFKDFATNRHTNVGIFSVPTCLELYANELLAGKHGYIGTGNCPVPYMNEMAFLILCCTLKTMDTTSFSDITKSLILKWRDAIRCALQFGFKIDFLKDRLKLVARGYLVKFAKNCREIVELQTIDVMEKRKNLDSDDKTITSKMAQMLEVLEDENDPCSLTPRDFSDIACIRYVDVGILMVPESLKSYAKLLLAKYPDIGNGNSPVRLMNEMAFTILCCALKSMDTTRFNEITKSLIFKWRDAIRGASEFGFKVEFLKNHLKSVAQACLGKMAQNSAENKKLQAIDNEILSIEKKLNELKGQRMEMRNSMFTELRDTCEVAALKFQGETCGFFSR